VLPELGVIMECDSDEKAVWGNAGSRAGSFAMDLLDDYEPDLKLAAARDVCVLIAAEPELALKVAQDIANRDRRKRTQIRVLDCDALDAFAVRRALSESLLQPTQPGNACGTLLLREVHALNAQNQSMLADLLAIVQPAEAPRIIASSSTSLFDRVRTGQFDDRLFYRLNMIYMAFNRA
jgi:transcriptional regulator of acetoin/glycerol metabolism